MWQYGYVGKRLCGYVAKWSPYRAYPSTYRLPPMHPTTLLGDTRLFCFFLVAQKRRRTILLHWELVTFNLHFPKSEKSSFSWFSDLVEIFMTPRNPYSWRWPATVRQKIREKTQIIFRNIILGDLRISSIGNLGKDKRQKMLESRLIRSWKSWMRDQYLPKIRNWNLNILNSTEGTWIIDFYLWFSAKGIPTPAYSDFPRWQCHWFTEMQLITREIMLITT